MKLINKDDLEDSVQYVCTWEYKDELFAITFERSEGSVWVMDVDGNFVEDECALEFGSESSNIQYWELQCYLIN